MIQPLSYIHPDAKVADNVIVEPFSTIHKNVEIGEGLVDWIQCYNYGWCAHRKEL